MPLATSSNPGVFYSSQIRYTSVPVCLAWETSTSSLLSRLQTGPYMVAEHYYVVKLHSTVHLFIILRVSGHYKINLSTTTFVVISVDFGFHTNQRKIVVMIPPPLKKNKWHLCLRLISCHWLDHRWPDIRTQWHVLRYKIFRDLP